MQKDVSAELKADGVADEDDAGEAETMIKEGVQAALGELEEC